MIPDLKFMRESFDSFRASIFGCPMPAPKFELTRAATFRGKFISRRVRGRLTEATIRLSLNFDLPHREWEDVMIHEMIHYLIALKGIQETPHGPTFRRMMSEINEKHGRDIRISHRAPASEKRNTVLPSPDMPVRRHYVCVARLADGRMGLFRAAASRLFRVWDLMKEYPEVTDWRWIGSVDRAFNAIPKSLNGALYVVKDYSQWLGPLRLSVGLFRNLDRIMPLSHASDDLPDWLDANFPE